MIFLKWFWYNDEGFDFSNGKLEGKAQWHIFQNLSFSPSYGNVTTQGQRKTLIRVGNDYPFMIPVLAYCTFLSRPGMLLQMDYV